MRIFVLIVALFYSLFAQEVEIKADKFSANEILGEGKFLGHVSIKKANDILKSDALVVKFNKEKKPVKYIANGNVSISIVIKNKIYFGKGDKLIYDPIKDKYSLKGNAFLEDKMTRKKVYGNNIHVNQKNGKYEVDSDKNTPVKFIFQIDDEKKW